MIGRNIVQSHGDLVQSRVEVIFVFFVSLFTSSSPLTHDSINQSVQCESVTSLPVSLAIFEKPFTTTQTRMNSE